MNKLKILGVAISSILHFISAEAALYDRGNGLVYDSEQNVTWLADFNYLGTQAKKDSNFVNTIISAVPFLDNNYDANSSYSSYGVGNNLAGTYALSTSDFIVRNGDSSLLTWYGAQALASQTSQINYRGIKKWRVAGNFFFDSNGASTNEVSYLLKNELGISNERPQGNQNTSLFIGILGSGYWLGSSLDAIGSNGNVVLTGSYFLGSSTSINRWSAMLVHDGDISNTSIATPTSIDLSTTLSQSSSRVKINENLTYTATVINIGTGTANNSLLKFYLPPRNISVVSMPSDCVTTGKSLTCSLGNLAAGANASRAIKVNYIKSGGASVSALVLTDSNDANSANNVSRIVTAITK